MKKYYLIALVLFGLCFGFIQQQHLAVIAKKGECTETYAPSLTGDAGMYIGQSDSYDFYGILYKPASSESICKLEVYIEALQGTLTSSHDYYCRIFSVDGNDDVDAILGTSSKLDGDALVDNTWTSANAGFFEFSSPVALTGGVTYAITFFIDRDSDLTDNPEFDYQNYPEFSFDNERNLDAVQVGRVGFTWDAAIPYADQGIDAEDDALIKIWTK